MKKRIIASLLVVVMLVLSLASCGSYDVANDDLSKYTEFDAAKFIAALTDGSIKITDGDFTTDETTRAQKIIDDIYSSIISSLTTKLGYDESIKLTAGTLGANDVVYFGYYVTDKDGNVVEYKYMGTDTNSSSNDSTSTKIATLAGSIKLPLVDEDYKDVEQELKKAIVAAIGEGLTFDEYAYKINSEKGTKAESDDTVVVKYTCTYKVKEEKKNENGETVLGDDGNPVMEEVTKTLTASYETLNLVKDSYTDNIVNNILVNKLLAENIEATVGTINTITTEGEGESATQKKTAITSFEETVGGITYSFSDVAILWVVEDAGKELASFTVKPEKITATDGIKVEVATQHSKGDKIAIKKDSELTYHVFPISYVNVPEITATSIITNVFGTSVKATSLEIFESEEYKNGDKTVKALVEELVKVQSNDADTIKAIIVTEEQRAAFAATVKDAMKDKTTVTLSDLKAHYDAKAKVVSDAGSKATTAQKDASKDAQKALNDVKDAKVAEIVGKIVAATAEGKDAIEGVIVKEYKHDVEHKLKEAYDKEVVEAIGEALWKLIDDSVKVVDYPAEMIEEFTKHIYEEYEYEFYNEKEYYKDYSGKLDDFLAKEKAKDYDGDIAKAVDAAAKKYIAPILKVFTVAKALEATAADKFAADVQLDIDQHAYDSFFKPDESLTDKENKKAEANAKKTEEENKKNALENAKYFVIDNDYMKYYKRQVGNAAYRQLVKDYGEINLRTSFQFNRLFAYFTSANLVLNEDGDHVETAYKDGKLDLRNIKYELKAED